MNRLTKRYNENIGIYEYVDAFSGAGIFDSILKKISGKFIKDTAVKIGAKAFDAGITKVGSEIGERAVNKVISKVDERFNKPKPTIPPIINTQPLGEVIIKELDKKTSTDNISPNNIKTAIKKEYYWYGKGDLQAAFPLGKCNVVNKKFQNKLNKLLI